MGPTVRFRRPVGPARNGKLFTRKSFSKVFFFLILSIGWRRLTIDYAIRVLLASIFLSLVFDNRTHHRPIKKNNEIQRPTNGEQTINFMNENARTCVENTLSNISFDSGGRGRTLGHARIIHRGRTQPNFYACDLKLIPITPCKSFVSDFNRTNRPACNPLNTLLSAVLILDSG